VVEKQFQYSLFGDLLLASCLYYPPIRGETNIIRVTLQEYVLKSSACVGELYLTRLAIVYGIVTATGAVYNVLYIFSSPPLYQIVIYGIDYYI